LPPDGRQAAQVMVSGFIFVDGKSDNKLYAEVLALARRFGREDDVLVLNFGSVKNLGQRACLS